MEQSFRSQENLKDLYSRVTEDAIKILNGMGGIDSRIKTRALSKIRSPKFKMEVKARWDEDTLRGAVDNDPEEQEKKWAKGLAIRLIDELSQEEKSNLS